MSVPPGLPPDARQVSLDELKNMAKLDPSLERLYQEVLKAKGQSEKKADTVSASGLHRAQVAKDGLNVREAVLYKGKEIYQWEQTLDEVHIYVPAPPGVPSKLIGCEIDVEHIKLGINIKSDKPQIYFDEALGGRVTLDESFMAIEDDTIHIYLQKASVGEAWPAALAAHVTTVNEEEAEETKRRLMLERFQRENPGFDFSRAKFSGNAPDAREFMGGIDRSKLK